MKTYPFLNDWIDDLIMCPSQCYLYFDYENSNQIIEDYCIYLRWRWNDPWQASLIKLDDSKKPENGKWIDLYDVGYFKEDQLQELKEAVIGRVKNELFIL
jgi:hypothetical protein